ncbi:NAD(P)H-dependent oxidoreductase [Parafrigoribacterium mesophilum]|uniref:NAD(P)H-dependent oxidoreductase n=1 Tax=Parafrigoribacterium mesophilum TaxID=433646 RepID=UPI0031FC9E29
MPATSQSRALADLVEAEWSAEHPDSVVKRRDLGSEPLPATLWRDVVTSRFLAEADRSPAQHDAHARAAALADELINADALLLAIPLYNWGVAAHVKTWYDVTYTDRRIAGGALKGKPVVLATVLGGNYSPGTPKERWDHSTPWLSHVIGEIWGADLLVVQRQLTLVGVNPALDQFTGQAAEIKVAAEQLAIEHGRALAAKRYSRVG